MESRDSHLFLTELLKSMIQELLSIFTLDSSITDLKTQSLFTHKSKMQLDKKSWNTEDASHIITELVNLERNFYLKVLETQESNYWKVWRRLWILITYLPQEIWLVEYEYHLLLFLKQIKLNI